MIGIYLLVALFSQITSNVTGTISQAEPAMLHVRFEKLSGIDIGAPVLVRGELAGTVSRIEPPKDESDRSIDPKAESQIAEEHELYTVEIKLTGEHRDLVREGSVALIASPRSASIVKTETVVELLVPSSTDAPVLADGADIDGFSSYEDFWLSPAGDQQI